MPTPTDDEISDAIKLAAIGPAAASNDTGSVRSHDLSDLIEFDRYNRGKTAANSATRGLRFSKIIPPGSV